MKTEKSSNVYDEIKERLASCKTEDDYISAYKWLAGLYVEANEEAKSFENKVIEKYGEKEFGILLYGNEDEYEKNKKLEKELENAKTMSERGLVLLKMIANTKEEEADYPDLWQEESDKKDAENER